MIIGNELLGQSHVMIEVNEEIGKTAVGWRGDKGRNWHRDSCGDWRKDDLRECGGSWRRGRRSLTEGFARRAWQRDWRRAWRMDWRRKERPEKQGCIMPCFLSEDDRACFQN